ncbi:hypothetical protein NMY22_g11842 [Coprinellus aureogranulatus]|nr:hypothetical protein NMY22_g11842 [Coprinellus aureogranulatus]
MGKLVHYNVDVDEDYHGDTCAGVLRGETPQADRSCLATLALVSRAFHSMAMPKIWCNVTISSQAHLKQASLVAEKHERLVALTERLVFQVAGLYDVRMAHCLVARMDALTVLVFANKPFGDRRDHKHLFPQAVVDAISSSCPNLENLHFRCLQEPPTLPQVRSIAEGCTRLRVLQAVAIEPLTLDPSAIVSFPLLHSLEQLSLGPGPSQFVGMRIETYEATKFHTFLRILSRHRQQLPSLRRIELYAPVSWTEPFVTEMRGKLDVMLCGSFWGVARWATPGGTSFASLRRLVIMVEPSVAEIPNVFPSVQVVEVVQIDSFLSPPDTQRLTQNALEELLRWRPNAQSLRVVILRTGQSYRVGQEEWISLFQTPFEACDVKFSVRELAP